MDKSILVERYVAVWNEPDETARRARVAELWSEDGAHFTPTLEARGHDAIAERIANAFERFIRPGEFRFRAIDNVDAHHGTIKFNWVMVPVSGGMAQTVGFDFFVLDDQGRIRADYQFIEP
jgi:ketosteroid isomerase-like protein